MSNQPSVCVGCKWAEWESEPDPLYPTQGKCRWEEQPR